MKLKHKVYLFALSVSLIIGLAVFFLIQRFESTLETRIGHEVHDLVEGAMDTVDRSLFLRMEEVELQPLDMQLDHLFEKANREYESMPERDAFIKKVDDAWKKKEDLPEIQQVLTNPLSQEFENKIHFLNKKFSYYVFSEIFATNRFGTVMGAFPRTTDFYQADEGWYQRAAQSDGVSVEDVHYDQSSGAYTIRVSKRTTDSKGELSGMVTASINMELVADILGEIQNSSEFKSLRFFLVDRQGRVLLAGKNPFPTVAASDNTPLETVFAHWPAVLASQKQSRKFHNDPMESGRALLAYAQSGGYKDYQGLGWTLVFTVNHDEFLSHVQDFKVNLTAVLLTIAAFLFIAIKLFVQHTTKPIERLTLQAEAISHGNWDMELAVQSKDEIGQLAQAFNRMTTVIKTHQDELEAKVEERTQKFIKAQKSAEEAREMDNAKSLFLINMSHEIRTPLNAILGYSQILQRSDNLTGEQKEKLSLVYRSGDHLLALINDILDVSKIEARKENLINNEFNLGTLILQLAEVTRVDCQQKELQFKLETFPLDEERWVWGDEGKLRRVLVKLLSNAAKFTESGGVLLRVTLRKKEMYRFEVVDTGPGIPPEEHGLIFEPFRQGKVGEAKGGTGMGLTICQRLVEIMDNKLEFESKPGKGSRFYFSLTLAPASKKRSSDTAGDGRDQAIGAPLIQALLIDDNKANLNILKELISTIGVEVQLATDGEQGLSLVESWKPDIIFLDQQMPGLTGVEVMKKVHQKYGKDRFKIVMTTASTLTHQTKEFLKDGADAVLRKPVVYEDLLEITRKLLKDKFSRSPSSTVPSTSSRTEPAAPLTPLNYESIEIPESLWTPLEHNARMGLLTEFEANMRTLKSIGDTHALLADRLLQLSRQFEFKKILNILNKTRKGNG